MRDRTGESLFLKLGAADIARKHPGVNVTSEAPVMFGKYEVLRRLAAGGMGEIYLARQRGLAGFDRWVIIKTLLAELVGEKEFLDQFLDEARVVATFNHPNIVSILEVGDFEGTYYIAMEYIKGGDLGAVARAAKDQQLAIPARVVAGLIRQAALGLDHAHNAADANGRHLGVVHRDVSPQNLMVRPDGVVKVVDFGVARASNRAAKTQKNVVKGKLGYMSPEQLSSGELDGSSDQFALGCVAWELLCGRRLFLARDNMMEVIKEVLFGTRPMVTEFRPDCPPVLEQAVMRMVGPKADRFPRCLDVANDMDEVLAATGGPADAELMKFIAPLLPADAIETEKTAPVSGLASLGSVQDTQTIRTTTKAKTPRSTSGTAWTRISTGHLTPPPITSPGLTVTQPLAPGEEKLELATEGRVGADRLRGRDREFVAVRDTLEKAQAGSAGLMILGDAGIGKTRLLKEAAKEATNAGMLVMEAKGGGLAVPVALETLEQCMTSLFRAIAAEPEFGHQTPARSVADGLNMLKALGVDTGLIRAAQQMFAGQTPMPGLETADAKQNMEGALLMALARAALTRPLCILVDDVHLADPASLELLESLASRIPQARLALIFSARPQPALMGWARTEALVMKGLDPTALAGVATGAMPGGALPASAAHKVQTAASGNPFLAQMQVRILMSGGALNMVRGRWQATDDLEGLALPTTVESATAAVCKGMPTAMLTVLQHAAAMGYAVDAAWVKACVGPGVEPEANLRNASEAGWLTATEVSGQYRFASATVRDVIAGLAAAAGQARPARLKLAETLLRGATLEDTRSQEAAARLLIAADNMERAIPPAIAAASRLNHRGVYSTAADLFRRVISRMRKQLEAGPPGDDRAIGVVLNAVAKATEGIRQINPAEAAGLLEPFARLGGVTHRPLLIEALRQRALAYLSLRKLPEAKADLDQAHSLCRAVDLDVRARLMRDQASAVDPRDIAENRRILSAALTLLTGQTAADPGLTAEICALASLAALRAGDVAAANQLALACENNARRARNGWAEPRAVFARALVARQEGKVQEALDLLGQAQELAIAGGYLLLLTQVMYHQSQLLLAERPDDANAVALAVVELTRAMGQKAAAVRPETTNAGRRTTGSMAAIKKV